MATNWPTSRDTFTNPSSGDTLDSPSHAAQHANINDAVEAMQLYAGLVLVKTQAIGSGVSSVTVTDAFSSTFDNYRIIMSGGTQSAAASIALTLGSSTTGYYQFLLYGDASAATVLGANRSNASRFEWCGGGSAGQASHASFDLFGPFLSVYTKLRDGQYQDTNGLGVTNGYHGVASPYDNFTLTPNSGTISGGTIRVYGYNNG